MPPKQPTSSDEAIIRRIVLFSSLNDPDFRKIMQTTRLISLQEGQSLFEFNQEAKHFYYVRNGQIKLFRVSREGHEKIIEIIQPGNIFAEAVVFMEKHRYPVNAAGLTSCQLYSFANDTLLELLEGSVKLCFDMLADLSKRLHRRLEEIDTLSLQNASYRVVHYLTGNIAECRNRSSKVVIELNAPKHAIASQLSITPETLSRILRALSEEEILIVQGRKIEILDINRLWEFTRSEKASYAGSREKQP